MKIKNAIFSRSIEELWNKTDFIKFKLKSMFIIVDLFVFALKLLNVYASELVFLQKFDTEAVLQQSTHTITNLNYIHNMQYNTKKKTCTKL